LLFILASILAPRIRIFEIKPDSCEKNPIIWKKKPDYCGNNPIFMEKPDFLRKIRLPGKPSSDTHDQTRKITLKTTTAKTTTFNRKKFGICLRKKTMIDYVICTVIPKVIITWYHTCHTVGLTGIWHKNPIIDGKIRWLEKKPDYYRKNPII
jgi:hypothetical protein